MYSRILIVAHDAGEIFVDGLVGANGTAVQFCLNRSSGVEAQKRSHKVVKRRRESTEFGRPSH